MHWFLFLFSERWAGTKTSRSGLLKWKYAEPLGFVVVPITINTFPCFRHSTFEYLTEQRVKYSLLPAIKIHWTGFFFLWENMCSGVWGVMLALATNISNHEIKKKEKVLYVSSPNMGDIFLSQMKLQSSMLEISSFLSSSSELIAEWVKISQDVHILIT